ncbi:signal peptidase II [Candidatus Uhrbacteria bacterium]|nr:MAG: signal peptidase II [Candidatus Uhrbacteria bacterium]
MIGKRILAVTAAFLAGAAALSVDLLSKQYFFDQVTAEGAAFSFFDGMIRSTLHQNLGISFNIPIPFWLVLLITGTALGWAVALLFERARIGRLISCIVLGVFIGGVIGNAFDRITLGFVRDWILLMGLSAINLADIFIAGSILAWIILVKPITSNR